MPRLTQRRKTAILSAIFCVVFLLPHGARAETPWWQKTGFENLRDNLPELSLPPLGLSRLPQPRGVQASTILSDIWCTIKPIFTTGCEEDIPVVLSPERENERAPEERIVEQEVATTTYVTQTNPTYITNEYVTNPTTIVRETVYRSSGGGDYVTRSFLENQVNAIYDSLDSNNEAEGVTLSSQTLSISGVTTLATTSLSQLTVTGAFLDGGGSAGSAGYILQSTGSGVVWIATSSLGISSGAVALEDLSDVAAMTEATGDLLYWTGAAWSNIATSSLGIGSSITFGTDNQIPYTNSGGTDFDYSSNFTFTGSALTVTGTANVTGTTTLATSGGNVGIGVSSPDSPLDGYGVAPDRNNGTAFDFYASLTSASQNQNGFRAEAEVAPSGAVSKTFAGLSGNIASYDNTTNLQNSTLVALRGYAYMAGTGTYGTVRGGDYTVQLDNVSGTINNAYGLEVFDASNSGTINQLYGMRIGAQTQGTNSNVGLNIGNASGSAKDTNLLLGTTTIPTGDFSIYNASTYDNYFAGNVGIGTDSPEFLLDVRGAGVQRIGVRSTNNEAYINIRSDTDDDVGISFQNNGTEEWLLYKPESTNDLRFYDGSDRLTLQSGGNVGIGTTTPGTLLTVAGAGYFTGNIGGGIESPQAQLHLYRNTSNTNTQLLLEEDGAGDVTMKYLLTATRSWVTGIDNSDSDKFKFAPADDSFASAVLTIDTSGNVGIGTTSPGVPLDVAGFIRSYNSGGAQLRLGAAGYQTRIGTTHTNSAEGYFYLQGSNDNFASNFKTLARYGQSSDDWQFFTNGSERVRIDSSGNVGIGTTTPSAKLDVYGTLRSLNSTAPTVGAGLEFSYNAGSGLGRILAYDRDASAYKDIGIGTNSGAQLYLKSDGVSYFNAGNVGIGTTSPSALLNLYSSSPTLLVESSDSNAARIGFKTTQGDWYVGSAGDNFYINTSVALSTSPAVTVLSSGNVGIGTTTPGKKLEVQDAVVNGAQARLSYSSLYYLDAGYNSILATMPGSSTNNLSIGIASTPTGAGQAVNFLTSNTTRMTINSSGNVGIGTSTPTDKLTIQGGDFVLNEDDGGGVAARLSSGNFTGQLSLNYNGSPTIYLDSNTSGASYFNAGNVGIGTTTPQELLEIVGSSQGGGTAIPTIRITDTDTVVAPGQVGGSFEFYATDPGLGSDPGVAGFMRYEAEDAGTKYALTLGSKTTGAEAVERLRIDSSGNVGIGTTTPGAKLNVYSSANLSTTPAESSSGLFVGTTAGGIGIDADQIETVGNGTLYLNYGSTGNVYLAHGDGKVSVNASSNNAQLNVQTTGTTDILNLFETGGTEVFTVLESGYVGIGDTIPENLLEVYGTSGNGIRIHTNDSSLGATANLFFETRATDASEPKAAIIAEGTGGSYGLNKLHFALEGTSDTSIVDVNDAKLTILNTGNVGIGTTTPDQSLTVAGDGHFTSNVGVGTMNTNPAQNNVNGVYLYFGGSLSLNRTGSTAALFGRSEDGIVVSFHSAGTAEGTVSVSGTTVSYNAFTGSHYAFVSGAPERGQLVSFTGESTLTHPDEPNSEPVYGAQVTTAANDPAVLGSYLALIEPTQPRSVENPELIMAVGNGDMWVVQGEEDALKPGDYLISSDTAGHAMKDPGTYAVSNIVARVTNTTNWSDVATTIDGKKHTKINVTFEVFQKDNRLDQLMSAEANASSTALLINDDRDTVWSRLVALAQNFKDGVLSIIGVEVEYVRSEHIDTDTINASTLCLGDVCVTESEFRSVFGNTGNTPPPQSGGGGEDAEAPTEESDVSDEESEPIEEETDEGESDEASDEEESEVPEVEDDPPVLEEESEEEVEETPVEDSEEVEEPAETPLSEEGGE